MDRIHNPDGRSSHQIVSHLGWDGRWRRDEGQTPSSPAGVSAPHPREEIILKR